MSSSQALLATSPADTAEARTHLTQDEISITELFRENTPSVVFITNLASRSVLVQQFISLCVCFGVEFGLPWQTLQGYAHWRPCRQHLPCGLSELVWALVVPDHVLYMVNVCSHAYTGEMPTPWTCLRFHKARVRVSYGMSQAT